MKVVVKPLFLYLVNIGGTRVKVKDGGRYFIPWGGGMRSRGKLLRMYLRRKKRVVRMRRRSFRCGVRE